MDNYSAEFEENNEEKEFFDFSDLSVVTTTKYGEDSASKIRAKLANKTFENLAKLNIQAFNLDGGSIQTFEQSLSTHNNVTVEKRPDLTMGESRRQAIRLALEKSDSPFILWTEPEKADLLKPESLSKLLQPLRSNETDIVIPRRISKESYPEFQAWIEKRGNKRLSELLENGKLEEIDFWFGPRIFSRDTSKYFLEDEGNEWDSIFTPIFKAARDGKRIMSVDIDYTYPLEQRNIEESMHYLRSFKQKRIEQYRTIITKLKYYNQE